MKLFSLILFLTFGNSLLSAVELEPGLSYFRFTVGQKQLPETKDGLVVDLRGATTEGIDIEVLPGALTARKPNLTFVLVNAHTASEILQRIPHQVGLVSLAPQESMIAVDLPLKVATNTDDKAVALIDGGANPNDLIKEAMKKPRYDEASLVRDHSHGSLTLDNDADADSVLPVEKNKSPKPDVAKPKEMVRDEILERSVQLFRAFMALKPR